MFPVLLALGLVGGLVSFAVRETVSPTIKPNMEKAKLEKLKSKELSQLKLNEAEDGAVLARRYGDKRAESYFKHAISGLRKKRVKI